MCLIGHICRGMCLGNWNHFGHTLGGLEKPRLQREVRPSRCRNERAQHSCLEAGQTLWSDFCSISPHRVGWRLEHHLKSHPPLLSFPPPLSCCPHTPISPGRTYIIVTSHESSSRDKEPSLRCEQSVSDHSWFDFNLTMPK